MDSFKLRRLAGIPIDLSKPENAKATIRTPKALTEAAKVPQHRGELAPKTKDNMKARVKHAQAALEALTAAQEALHEIPAVDYMEDIPTIIKQLHHMLHGEDGTGGVHHLHRTYKHDFDNTVFPEDVEEDKRKAEEEAAEAGMDETNESLNPAPTAEKPVKSDGLGFEKPKAGPAVEKKNVRAFKLADGSDSVEDSMYSADAENVEKDPRERTPTPKDVQEAIKPEVVKAAKDSKELADANLENPFGKKDKKKEVKAEEEEMSEEDDDSIDEAAGPLFARDATHPNHEDEEKYPSWVAGSKRPVNVVSAEDGVSPYYPQGSKSESPSQIPTNPYNENQAVKVPAKIKSSLKSEADIARKLAETFTMRKDWDNKNFHENLANAFDTLNGFLDKGTIYGIKEAQVFMTSLMSPIMNKIPTDVIKFVAAGGAVRSLKSYMNDVKEPVTGVVYQQDSDGVK